MQRSWYSARSWIAIGATTWLAVGGLLALPLAPAAESTRSADCQTIPLAVANPYATSEAWQPQLPAKSTGVVETSWIPVTGAVIEGDAPALYRLPSASSIPPAPAETLVDDVVPPALTVALPSPPVTNVVAPPLHRVADVRGSEHAVTRRLPLPAEPNEEEEDRPEPRPEASFDTDWPTLTETPPTDKRPSSPWPATTEIDNAVTRPAVSISDPGRRSPSPPPQRPQPPRMSSALTQQLLPAVQRGYALAQRGAMYAARAEFVQVLGRVVQAKDAASNSEIHSQALAAGLRAVDEAEDFVPTGVTVEAELDVRIVASSHRTPVLGECPADVSPHEAVALYHRYAQQQLALAVAGEQAGSMALHGLGKVAATLAERGDGDPALVRCATTMYSAALATCPMNHLAANELGVLLVRQGRVGEAARLFERTIDFAPSATAYHNLAVAQGKLGFHSESAANEQQSQRLAAVELANGALSKRAGIEWVTPEQMSGIAQPGLVPTAQMPPRPKSVWRKTVEMAKSLPFVGTSKTQ